MNRSGKLHRDPMPEAGEFASALLTTSATVSLLMQRRFAIRRLQPDLQRLYAFARVTSSAAKRNILSGDYASIIRDMFPARMVSRIEHYTAIDTTLVPQNDLSLKPSRDAPTVHFSGVLSEFPLW
jgi:hypothetical protein